MKNKFEPGKLIRQVLCILSVCLYGACDSALQEEVLEKTAENELSARSSTDAHTRPQVHKNQVLFDGGTGGYHSYRIPSIVRTTQGTLLAFAQGRRWHNKDYGDINLVYKRSTDNGNTWSPMMTAVGITHGSWAPADVVTDWDTGRIWMFLSWNDANHNLGGTDGHEPTDEWGDRRVFLTYSDDDGLTWIKPIDMTETLLPPEYRWDTVGPGVGIQTKRGPNPGRLIIPAYRRNIYSDDHGATWHYQRIPFGTDEGTIVELMDGTLMRNDRPGSVLWPERKRRQISTGSIENGFSAWTSNSTLLDPKCQGSMIRYNTNDPHRIIFLNPATTIRERRCKMRVRISYDDGATWPVSRRIHDYLSEDEACNRGLGGYSSMTKTADYCIGALIEVNEDINNRPTSHRSIEFHKFNLPWIVNGVPEPI